MNTPRIAFFGLGYMGGGMAGRLSDAGFPLAVFNRNRQKALLFEGRGARVAASPAEAAKDADILISMVADVVASQEIWTGKDGALGSVKPGAIVIESSTLTVEWVLRLNDLVRSQGGEFLDAPVTGSRIPAANGELIFYVGGDAETLEKCRSVLALMARNIVLVGPVGSGSKLKLVNNLLFGVQLAAFAEAEVMIERCGLNREQVWAILSQGALASPFFKLVLPRLTTPDYTPNFPLHLMSKDLGYIIEQNNRNGTPTHLATAAHEIFKKAICAGHGHLDMSAILEILKPKKCSS